jgi:hypothetical protein
VNNFSKYNEINVPVELFIYAYQNKFSRELRFWLLLKLYFPEGKFINTNETLNLLQFQDNIKSQKTLKKYITKLINLNLIHFNQKINYYIISSFDKVRKRHNLTTRISYKINSSTYHKIYSVTGAVIFAYLHRDFWRKVKRDKVVTLEGVTYYSLSFKTDFRKSPAPISVYGAEKIFNIPATTLSYLKNLAANENLITVKKNFTEIPVDKLTMEKMASFYSAKKNLIFINDQYYLQLIDLISPNLTFSKRKSIVP